VSSHSSLAGNAILLVHCPDRQGLVAAVSSAIHRWHGNVVDLDQHVDAERGVFFMRVEWDLTGFGTSLEEFGQEFAREVAGPFEMRWQLHRTSRRQRVAIFVSKYNHCLYDMLARWQSGEWAIDIPVVVSNHTELADVARRYDLRFEHVPVTKDTKPQAERQVLDLLTGLDVDLLVLARYMQVLSPEFVRHYPERIINIHHSFLPAFVGANPYRAAFARGVKLIGATSHYVTDDLDAGPIIAQATVPVSHRDSVDDMVRKGRDLEKIVLARAVHAHLSRRVLAYDNRTVVFE
jgi:formyltetrahydrofolate deformylase